jgi:hypothetical protein
VFVVEFCFSCEKMFLFDCIVCVMLEVFVDVWRFVVWRWRFGGVMFFGIGLFLKLESFGFGEVLCWRNMLLSEV